MQTTPQQRMKIGIVLDIGEGSLDGRTPTFRDLREIRLQPPFALDDRGQRQDLVRRQTGCMRIGDEMDRRHLLVEPRHHRGQRLCRCGARREVVGRRE